MLNMNIIYVRMIEKKLSKEPSKELGKFPNEQVKEEETHKILKIQTIRM